MLTVIPVLLQILEAGLTVAPGLIAAAQTEAALVTSVSPPTPEQRAAIDAALDEANAALQAAQPAA